MAKFLCILRDGSSEKKREVISARRKWEAAKDFVEDVARRENSWDSILILEQED